LRKEAKKMKKIFVILIFILLTATIIPMTALAGDEENPEIRDEMGDAFGNIDIHSVWFSEIVEEPNSLFVYMKINNMRLNKIQQTFAVFWQYNGIQYACGLFIGLHLFGWELWTSGEYINRASGGGPNYVEIDKGTYNQETGIITWKIPKEIIGDPNPDDILTKTWSNAFQRYGLLGLVGFSRPIISVLFSLIFGNSLWDHAPNPENYGLDYIIQY
jgi:hypothetical protein